MHEAPGRVPTASILVGGPQSIQTVPHGPALMERSSGFFRCVIEEEKRSLVCLRSIIYAIMTMDDDKGKFYAQGCQASSRRACRSVRVIYALCSSCGANSVKLISLEVKILKS